MQDIREISKTFSDWNKNINRLSHRVLLEMPGLKTRWGFFVLLLKIADQNGVVKISVKDLSAITGAVRKNIYTILRILDKKGYIRYTPAKNGHRKLLSIQILEMERYVAKRNKKPLTLPSPRRGEGKGTFSIDRKNEEMIEAQRDLLMYNTAYRRDTVGIIKGVFRDRLRMDVHDEIIFGKANSLLWRFLADDIVRCIKRLNGNGDNGENPIGDLIIELEGGGIEKD